MEFEEWTSVGDSEESDIQFLGFVVKLSLDVHTNGACAFIKNGEKRFMIKQSRHCHTLFLSSRENVCPVIDWVESAFSVLNVVKPNVFQK